MCWKVDCPSCGKATWEGCGFHITHAMTGVDEKDRCSNWLFGVTSGCSDLPDPELNNPRDAEFCGFIESNDSNNDGGHDDLPKSYQKSEKARRMSYKRKGGDAFRFTGVPKSFNLFIKGTKDLPSKVQHISLRQHFNIFRDVMNKEISKV